jgi:hypothetical protein
MFVLEIVCGYTRDYYVYLICYYLSAHVSGGSRTGARWICEERGERLNDGGRKIKRKEGEPREIHEVEDGYDT